MLIIPISSCHCHIAIIATSATSLIIVFVNVITLLLASATSAQFHIWFSVKLLKTTADCPYSLAVEKLRTHRENSESSHVIIFQSCKGKLEIILWWLPLLIVKVSLLFNCAELIQIWRKNTKAGSLSRRILFCQLPWEVVRQVTQSW